MLLKAFEEIKFYLILFFLIRLIGITDPPLESSHNWRQCFTNMISRNFSESKLDLLRPMVDLGGAGTGIVGSEFPLFNFLIYLFNETFGYDHWYGRLINLIVSTIGIYFFHKLIKSLFSKSTALYSSLVLLVSIWFAFSRKIMPDTFSVSLVIIGLYFGYSYLTKGKLFSLLSYFALCTLGVLCKIPSLSILSIIAILPFIREINRKRIFSIWISTALSLCFVCTWYFYWTPLLLEQYNFQLYIPKGIMEGIQEIIPLFPELLKRFYFTAFRSYIAFPCFILGLFFLIKQRKYFSLIGFSTISVVFALFIIKTGNVFPLHSYYIIPFVPVMAVLIGYFLSTIPSRFRYLILCAIMIEAIANQQHDFKIKDNQLHLLALEEKVNQNIGKKDLVITTGGRTYKNMYFAHRKGWVAYNRDILRKEFTDSLANLGAKYLIVNKQDLEYVNPGYEKVFDDQNYAFFNLNVNPPIPY